MGKFGWSYPPGCSSVPGDEPEQPCIVCGYLPDGCICPECPTCHEFGNPFCYESGAAPDQLQEAKNWVGWQHPHHGLKMTYDQMIGRAQYNQAILRQQIRDIGEYIWFLERRKEEQDETRNLGE